MNAKTVRTLQKLAPLSTTKWTNVYTPVVWNGKLSVQKRQARIEISGTAETDAKGEDWTEVAVRGTCEDADDLEVLAPKMFLKAFFFSRRKAIYSVFTQANDALTA